LYKTIKYKEKIKIKQIEKDFKSNMYIYFKYMIWSFEEFEIHLQIYHEIGLVKCTHIDDFGFSPHVFVMI